MASFAAKDTQRVVLVFVYQARNQLSHGTLPVPLAAQCVLLLVQSMANSGCRLDIWSNRPDRVYCPRRLKLQAYTLFLRFTYLNFGGGVYPFLLRI